MTTDYKRPTLLIAFVPIVVLIGFLALNVVLFGGDASWGPNQIALIIATTITCLLAYTLGFRWKEMLGGMAKSIASTIPAVMILLLIGALTGTWLLSGVIPTMVYYGLDLLNPTIFLFAACLISSIVSLATGSSWSTVGTVGIALLGIGETLGFSSGLVAGAVISGAYFGDKMSPLSDTTNLAPAMAGTNLFTHIRHMAWTTVPSITITLLIFLFLGFAGGDAYNPSEVDFMMNKLDENFFISPLMFLVPVGVIVLILLKVPAIPALLAGIIMGAIFGLFAQPEIVRNIGETNTITLGISDDSIDKVVWDDGSEGATFKTKNHGEYTANFFNKDGANLGSAVVLVDTIVQGDGWASETSGRLLSVTPDNFDKNITCEVLPSSYWISGYEAVTLSMYGDIAVETQNAKVDKLLTSDGMQGMLSTIWLIVCAMSFGGIMEATGMLQRITDLILTLVRSTGSLILATASTCLFFNITAADQYLAIVVPGRMFSSTYRKKGLKPENLSRTLEDTGTVTSALIPWNTCGAYHSSTLGVATGDYFMFAFFNLISPIMTVLFGFLGWKVPSYTEDELAALELEEQED